MMKDERIDAKTRQGWFKRYTDANRALLQTLKAREDKEWEKRLEIIREYRQRAALHIDAEPTQPQTRESKQTGEGQ